MPATEEKAIVELENCAIKTISCTYGRKVNLGDYNSAELSISFWADLKDGGCPDEARKELQEFARASVRDEYVRLMNSTKSRSNGN